MQQIKALTLWEPWASYIADGFKRYETRGWTTSYRGLVAIHAAKRWQKSEQQILERHKFQFAEIEEKYADYAPPLGEVICVCKLVDVHETDNLLPTLSPMERAMGDYSSGRYAWELEVIEVFDKGIPATGQQGLWAWDYSPASETIPTPSPSPLRRDEDEMLSAPPEEDNEVERQPLRLVLPIAQDMAGMLAPACGSIKIAGSLRRYYGLADKMVKDAELLIVPKYFGEENALNWLLDKMLDEGVIAHAEKKSWGDKYRKFVYRGVKFDVFQADEMNAGSQYVIRTGPWDANREMFGWMKRLNAPFRHEDGYVWHGDVKLKVSDELDWYDLLGIDYLPPNTRTKQAYKRAFENHRGWGNPKKYYLKPPTQKSFGWAFNELQLINALEKAGKIHADKGQDISEFKWHKPWIVADDYVWVWDGWRDGERQYCPAHVDSERAKKQVMQIRHPMFYKSASDELQRWLDNQVGYLPVPDFMLENGVEDLPASYGMSHSGTHKESVALANIRFMQETYHPAIMREYFKTLSVLDVNGLLPFGVRFSDSDAVYVLDGTHRVMAHYLAKQNSITMEVTAYPETLREALGLDYDDADAQAEFFADVLEEVADILEEGRKEKIYG